ncbi:hormogonium polysaccharide secretion pseudopilin HpsB [Trichocoleus sp. ST-U3]
MKYQLKRLSPPSTQSGFTIIESLLAILIVTALLVAIAPVITLSVATRLQARRVEQGTQAARTYIDGVRSGKLVPPTHIRVLNEVEVVGPLGNKRFDPNRERFSNAPAPPSITIANCRSAALPNFPYCRNQPNLSLYCADFDGDDACKNSSTTDLIVQAFRSGIDTNDDGSKGYLLGVRVYRAAAFNGGTDFQTTKERGGKKVATNTGGTGDYRAPLVEMTTEVQSKPNAQAAPEKQYEDFCDRLGGCQ